MYITWLSKRLYHACDRILVTSKPFINYLSRNHNIPYSRFGYLPQHADGSMLTQDLSKTEDDGKVHFMYAGNFGAGQTLDVIIRAAAILGIRMFGETVWFDRQCFIPRESKTCGHAIILQKGRCAFDYS